MRSRGSAADGSGSEDAEEQAYAAGLPGCECGDWCWEVLGDGGWAWYFKPANLQLLELQADVGLDSHFQINYLSQVLLTMTLLPTLLSTSRDMPNSSPRIVLQSSDLHRGAPSDTHFADKSELNTPIGPMLLYNRSKLAQVLFVRRLHHQLQAGMYGPGKIYVNATHPGGVSTDQQEQAVEAYGTLGKIGVAAVRPLLSDPVKTGCRSALFAATAREVVEEDISGQYIVPDCKVTKPSKQAMDEALGEQLWTLGEQLLREQFGGKLPYSESV